MLVLSGSAELKAASYLILLRAEDFLAKPMDLERLLNVIGERLLLRSIVQ